MTVRTLEIFLFVVDRLDVMGKLGPAKKQAQSRAKHAANRQGQKWNTRNTELAPKLDFF